MRQKERAKERERERNEMIYISEKLPELQEKKKIFFTLPSELVTDDGGLCNDNKVFTSKTIRQFTIGSN